MEELALGRFSAAFPPDSEGHLAVEGLALAKEVFDTFKIEVPRVLVEFWSRVGAGYFGGRALYVFGTDACSALPRHSLCEWNRQSFWREIFPEPKDGGPLFFAETCLGEQVGFRLADGEEVPLLFLPDTCESFVLGSSLKILFQKVLTSSDALSDPERLRRVIEVFGIVPSGMHFSPVVSPLVGGTGDVANFQILDPVSHLRTAIAEYKAIN